MDMFRKVGLIVLLCSWVNLGFGFDDSLDEKTKNQIDWIDLKTREIVIDDWVYKLALDLKVHGAKGQLETDFALKQGQSVKYEVDPSSMERDVQTIVDIWLVQE